MPEQIKVTREGPIEIIAFCNPPKNFLSQVMLEEFYEELLRVRDDAGVRVLILTGGLEDSFVTHYDVSELLEYAEVTKAPPQGIRPMLSRFSSWMARQCHRRAWLDRIQIKSFRKKTAAELSLYFWGRCMELLDTMPKPVIAAISGLCLGGGCELSLTCDFRFMAKGEHYRIGLPEVLVGIIPGGTGTTLRLPRIVGEARALEMLLTGLTYEPEEAEAIGLVHRAVPPEELMPTVMELAERLARGAPVAQAAIRHAVRNGSRQNYREGRVQELLASINAISSEDAKEGMRRYVEDVTSKYEMLALEEMANDMEDMFAGRIIRYEGK
jgi:enoyl-CoA hydratase/carnithine racemase